MTATNTDPRGALEAMRHRYRRLHDALSDAVEAGRLTAAELPDDYAALVQLLIEANTADQLAADALASEGSRAEQLAQALREVLPYAESRAEDLEEHRAAGREDPAYPGAAAAWQAIESARALLDNDAPPVDSMTAQQRAEALAAGPISDDEMAAFLHDLLMEERDRATASQTAQAMAEAGDTAARILDPREPNNAALIEGLREGYGIAYGLRLHQDGQSLCVIPDPDTEQGRAIYELAEYLAELAREGVSTETGGPLQ